MTDRTQPLALMLADRLHHEQPTVLRIDAEHAGEELRRQHARIAELEAQLESIGAGGVSGPLMGQPQAMPDLSALTERGAKAWAGVDAQGLREGVASVAAIAPAPSGHIKEPYTVAEIKAKIASHDYSAELLLQHAMLHLDRLAASAGSEPVAQPSDADAILSKVCDLFHIGKLARTESTILVNIRNVIDHAGLLRAVERDLFPQPELPEDDDPYAAVDESLPAPNSWSAKDEADYVAQFRAALAARGFTHPSPPEGMVGGWRPIETAPKDGTAILLGSRGGSWIGKWLPIYRSGYRPENPWSSLMLNHDHMGEKWCKPTHWMPLPLLPTTPAGSGKGE